MAEPEQSVEAVKRALLRDIDAGKVYETRAGDVLLDLGEDGDADVTEGAWPLYRDDLVIRRLELTGAGRAYLKAVDG